MGEAAWQDDYEILTELIDGKIVMMSPRPRITHNDVAGAIYTIFRTALRGKRCRAFPDGTEVHLDEKNHFVPDVMIVCDPSQIKETYIEGAPTLVVEVLSPSTQLRDRTVKMQTYGAAGVKEYWIVDTISKYVEVYRQKDGQLMPFRVYTFYTPEEIAKNETLSDDFRLSKEDMEQEIRVDYCGGFSVPLADVFEGTAGFF